MKRKVLILIGLALFVGAVTFNLQMNSSNNETSDLTLKNIKALTASAEESGDGGTCKVTSNCYDEAGEIVGSVSCTSTNNDCSRGYEYVICDDTRTEC